MVYLCNENRDTPVVQWSFGRLGVCDGLKIHRTWFNSTRLRNMVVVAQLARAPDCGSGGRGFEPLHSPKREYSSVAERMAVNHRVVGSSPSIPASMEVWPRGLRRHPAKVLNSSRGSESSNLSASATLGWRKKIYIRTRKNHFGHGADVLLYNMLAQLNEFRRPRHVRKTESSSYRAN